MMQISSPAVSVITRPTIEMGRIAAKMLLNQLGGKPNQHNRRVIDVYLTRRDSVACISEEE